VNPGSDSWHPAVPVPSEPRPIQSAIVASRGAGLRGLVDLLASVGVSVSVVDTVQDAAARLIMSESDQPPVVFVDLGDIDRSDPVGAGASAEVRLRAITDTVPLAAPVAVAGGASAVLVIAALRGGAADFLDLGADGGLDASAMRAVLDRIARLRHERTSQRRTLVKLRAMMEEFLKDLIKTERRSIDLEHRLAQRDRQRSGIDAPADLDADREPCVFLIEDDREVADQLAGELEDAGIVTFAFLSGEDAVMQAEKMAARGQAIDLALVDLRLPGMDGLEAVRRLRDRKPGLAAFLMTGFSDVETATSAADLGVVGFVLKPFDDVHALIARIKELATQAVQRTRDHVYLQRIKERHDKVLSRYRKLATEIDR
jgi:FixJ family two-component response regulator